MMMTKRKAAAARDGFEQGTLPFLWPDKDGSLNTRASVRGRLSGSPSQRSLLLPHAVVVKISRLQRSQSLSSWLSSRSSIALGFGKAKLSLFEVWLLAQLDISDFNAQSMSSVLGSGVEELHIDGEQVRRLLISATRRGGKFRSDEGIITIRE
jgi:hypothetical protein